MDTPAESFLAQKEAVREQVEAAIAAYQQLTKIDLTDVTRENAAKTYQEFVAIEATFEGVGGVLDSIRAAIHTAGDNFTDQLELVGFDGEGVPTITEIVEDEEYGAAISK
ncbi:MAG: hypothetical protein ABGY41_18640 [Candidatus Poribacteria bacterium]